MSNPKNALKSIVYKELVKVSGLILVKFLIHYNWNTIGFNDQKVKAVLGKL